ncbi:MAG: radical SAM family heme chaperone HemW [Thermaerobacterales bacterium]
MYPAQTAEQPVAADPDAFGPGLYVHIPFCARKCFYCDFTAYFHRDERAERYVSDLLAEIKLAAAALAARQQEAGQAEAISFRTVFFGGGTPSILTASQLSRIFDRLHACFSIPAAAEFTLEANPGTLTPDRLEAMRRGGANRLSIGAQARQPHLLAALGRDHGWDDVEAGAAAARAAGFDNFNIDLMFGLPGQSMADWQESLAAAAALEPAHVSSYGLEVEPHTSYGRWQREGRLRLPPDDLQRGMMEVMIERLAARGFEHYEISNFARPGRRSRHNLNYWANGDYLGLGAGAWSHWQGARWGNLRYLKRYHEAVAAGVRPVDEVDEPDQRTRKAEAVILGTRLVEGMPRSWFYRRFDEDVTDIFGPELARLTDRGWLSVDDDRIALTAEGRLLANEVWMTFL